MQIVVRKSGAVVLQAEMSEGQANKLMSTFNKSYPTADGYTITYSGYHDGFRLHQAAIIVDPSRHHWFSEYVPTAQTVTQGQYY